MDIFIYGIQRSGNHVIIDWLFNNVCNNRFKNVEPIKWGKYGTGYQLDGFKFINNDHNMFEDKDNNGPKLVNYTTDNEVQIISIENPDLETQWNYIKTRRDPNRKLVNIIILRDIANTMASMLPRISVIPELFPRYRQYSKEVLGETHILDNMIPILYNRFIGDRNYRNEIMAQIGFPNHDVIRQSGHSSFCYDTQYNRRYTAVTYPENQKVKLQKDDIVDYTKRIFDMDVLEIIGDHKS